MIQQKELWEVFLIEQDGNHDIDQNYGPDKEVGHEEEGDTRVHTAILPVEQWSDDGDGPTVSCTNLKPANDKKRLMSEMKGRSFER